MIDLEPISRALIPTNSDAAARISDRNYDEFQGDHEIRELLQERPESILSVTMAHCQGTSVDQRVEDGSPAALERAGESMKRMITSSATRVVEGALWVYEILDPERPGLRQIGLGGMAATAQIRGPSRPDGTIIRNEGIREPKAQGRARLIEATSAYIGVVNNTFEDPGGRVADALEAVADARPADLEVIDESGCTHRSWLEVAPDRVAELKALMATLRCAYVADGNHRSAAAAALGHARFLAVFFPADRMGLAPYNRLVDGLRLVDQPALDEPTAARRFFERLSEDFEVEARATAPAPAPGELGLYLGGQADTPGSWSLLRARPHCSDPTNAVSVIDADIVQRRIFERLLGIADARDARLTFVGGDRPIEYLVERVDSGGFAFALSLAPVSMAQIIEVCEQERFMPPKSTWFQPKVRIGLVIALF